MTNSFWEKIRKILGESSRTPEVEAREREVLLQRARWITWIGFLMIPGTIISYDYLFFPKALKFGMVFSLSCSAAIFAVWMFLDSPFFRKYYHIPLFLYLGVIANFAEIANYHATGGGSGFFFFPYLLIFTAIGVLLLGRLKWICLTCLVVIGTYIGSELYLGRSFNNPIIFSNAVSLINTAIIIIVGNRAFYSFFLRDTRRQVELEELNTRLKELDRAKSEFFANISHELKTPMALVLAPVETALARLSKDSPGFLKGTFEAIRHNAYRLSALIDDLLDLTRSEVGKVQIRPEEVSDTKEYFENIFNSVVPLMKEKGIRYEFMAPGKGDL